MLKPHYKNFNKTVVKRPKLFFYDSSLVCYLLGIRNAIQLENHPLRGAIFEGMVVTELLKNRMNAGVPNNLFFWRDKTGREVDIIIDNGDELIPLEIKSGRTITTEYFKNIEYYKALSGSANAILVYAGSQVQNRSSGVRIVNWKNISKLLL